MKQITAKDMQEAMQLARRDFGEDAILLNSRKASGGKGIIVTFAMESYDDIPIPADPLEEEDFADLPFNDVDVRPMDGRRVEIDHPALEIIDEALTFHGVADPLLSRLRIAVRSAHIPAATVLDAAESMLAEGLAKQFQFAPITGQTSIPSKAFMLVGMHGAGKTTTLAKLATMLTLEKKPVVLVSTDTERFGGTDALAGLAEILNVPLLITEDRAELRAVLKQHLGKAWVLVDSFGVNFYAFNELKSLGELASLQDVEPVMVCPAGMDPAEAQEMASVFSFLSIGRMIVTRADATRHFGSVLSALSHTRYQLANISTSASPADACAPFTPELFARLLLTAQRERMTN